MQTKEDFPYRHISWLLGVLGLFFTIYVTKIAFSYEYFYVPYLMGAFGILIATFIAINYLNSPQEPVISEKDKKRKQDKELKWILGCFLVFLLVAIFNSLYKAVFYEIDQNELREITATINRPFQFKKSGGRNKSHHTIFSIDYLVQKDFKISSKIIYELLVNSDIDKLRKGDSITLVFKTVDIERFLQKPEI
jgi:hypothetical protein